MGQPIKLVRGDDEMIVYGQAQARVHMADGWQLEGVVQEPQPEEKPTVIEKPKPAARKPKAKK